MKVHLVVPALVLLQLVCPGAARAYPSHSNVTSMLNKMYKVAISSNATIPGNLRNATVPIMEICDEKTFCKVQQVLLEFAGHSEIQVLCRSLVLYNNFTKNNCTKARLQMTNETVTFELQDLFRHFIDCIREENLSQRN